MYVKSFYNSTCKVNKYLLTSINNIETKFYFFRKIKYIYNTISRKTDTHTPKSKINRFTSRKLGSVSLDFFMGINSSIGFLLNIAFLSIFNNVIFYSFLLLFIISQLYFNIEPIFCFGCVYVFLFF